MGSSSPVAQVAASVAASHTRESALMKLSNGQAMLLRVLHNHLALIALVNESALSKKGLLEYNLARLQQTTIEVLQSASSQRV